MTQRDYSKFIRDDGRLFVRMIPRPVYVAMVKDYQQRLEIIEEVFEDLYWLWDLNQNASKAEAEGRVVSRTELAAEIIADMDDADWWKVTEAFEEHLITHFAANPAEWAEALDPVYDLQEREGWREQQ